MTRTKAPYWCDFNATPKPTHEHAAAHVTHEQLTRLFEGLDQADERFDADPRAAVLDALKSVVEFAGKSPYNGAGRFSRPFELLFTELRDAPAPLADNILPACGTKQKPGTLRRRPQKYIKAAAAYTADYLHQRDPRQTKILAAAFSVSDVLAEHDFLFAFGRHDDDRPAAIKRWRENYLAGKGAPAPYFQKLKSNPPLGPDAPDWEVLAWLRGELHRAGYARRCDAREGRSVEADAAT